MYFYHIHLYFFPSSSRILPPTSISISCPVFVFFSFFYNHWVQFVFLIYSWVWGHSLAYGPSTRNHTLEESCSPFPRNHLITIAPQEQGPMSPTSLVPVNIDWLDPVQVLHSSYSYWVFMKAVVHCFPLVLLSLRLLWSPTSSSTWSLNLQGRRCDIDVPLAKCAPEMFILCILITCKFLH